MNNSLLAMKSLMTSHKNLLRLVDAYLSLSLIMHSYLNSFKYSLIIYFILLMLNIPCQTTIRFQTLTTD